MSYKNFIPTVWNEAINRELEKDCVFVEDCNRKYEGDVKQIGDSVRILGVGKPTIKHIARADATKDIDAPEEIEDTSVTMNINQIAYFNYMVGDIDKKQATGGVMEALNEESGEGIADDIDQYIANLAKDKVAVKVYNTAMKVVAKETTTSGEVYVLDALDKALEYLYKNNVKTKTTIVATVSPQFLTILKKAYRFEDTNNSKLLKNGYVGMYNTMKIKMSNNVAKDNNGNELIQIKTQRAIAFANPVTHTEPYRPEKKFADAVKGFTLYDAKIVRPKEMFVLNVKY